MSADECTYTKEQLQEIARRMQRVSDETYWLFFHAGMGSSCHAFLEFNGLISKYVQVCARAAEEGIDFTMANVHSNTPLPVEEHDMEYLAEKLGCIFGPLIASNPEAAAVLRKGLFGEEQSVGGDDVSVPPQTRADVHTRLTHLVDENLGYRPTMPIEALLSVLEAELPQLVAREENTAEETSDS